MFVVAQCISILLEHPTYRRDCFNFIPDGVSSNIIKKILDTLVEKKELSASFDWLSSTIICLIFLVYPDICLGTTYSMLQFNIVGICWIVSLYQDCYLGILENKLWYELHLYFQYLLQSTIIKPLCIHKVNYMLFIFLFLCLWASW